MTVTEYKPLYSNEGVSLTNPNYGGYIGGKVSSDRDALFLIPVEYNKFWIDDMENDKLYRADFAFIAKEIKAGETKISLMYKNTVYKTSFFISLISVIALAIFLAIQHNTGILKNILLRVQQLSGYLKK
jgi:uncharacterized membrane protein YfhO